jgi:archaemetzincin
MTPLPHRIAIIPMGEAPVIAAKVIAAHISGYLNLQAVVMPPSDLPLQALDKGRLQYNAGRLIQQLESRPMRPLEKIVAVFSVDLFLPVFTHVFGEARQGGRVALVSLFRLGKDSDELWRPSSDTLERTAKVALHELCHLYHLTHCENHACLMHFSGSLEALDKTPLAFCRYCRSFFREAVSRQSCRE